MGNILLVTGLWGNVLQQLPPGAVTCVPDADPLYPLENAYDGQVWNPFRWGFNAEDCRIDVDLQLLVNGDLNLWEAGAPVDWRVVRTGSAVVAEQTMPGLVVEGSSVRLSNMVPGDLAMIEHDVDVAPGQVLHYSGRVFGVGAGGIIWRIQNLQTRSWLGSDHVWTPAQVDLGTFTGSTWTRAAGTFAVEPYGVIGTDRSTLRLSILKNPIAAGTVHTDLWELTPVVNFLSIHGHNIDPGVPVDWQHSADAFDAEDILLTSLQPRQPSFFGTYGVPGSGSDRRYQRLQLVGINSEQNGAPWCAAVILGHAVALQRFPSFPIRIEEIGDQIRERLPVGPGRVHALSHRPRRRWAAPFSYRAPAEYLEAGNEIARRSGGGRYPAVLVPLDIDPAVCLYGHFRAAWPTDQNFVTVWNGHLELEEFGVPSLGRS